MKLMSKIILITGASSGFGKVTAELLCSRGCTVYGTSRKACSHAAIKMLVMDVRDRQSVRDGVERIIAEQGRIDVLINNAGMGIGGALELATEEEIAMQMETNFGGCVNLCQAVLPHMRRQRSGRIVNLSSIGGVMGLPYQGYYSASKYAIEGFSEALSAEVKGFGIQVSVVEPGDFATHFTASRRNSQATMDDADYGPIFRRSLGLIEKEENGGLKPEVLAKKLVKIVECKRPKLRYVVANFEQRLSVLIKRLVSGNCFVDILRDYYKTAPDKH